VNEVVPVSEQVHDRVIQYERNDSGRCPVVRVQLIRHELTHQDQMARLGVRFYIQYLRQYAKYGSNMMPLEIEARESEK
jgi:hypothetical protein